jgi:hypothetical protein
VFWSTFDIFWWFLQFWVCWYGPHCPHFLSISDAHDALCF